jgi:acetyl-CoA acetyltransferase
VVVISAVPTPVARFGGGLSGVRADDLAGLAIRAAVERSGVEPGEDNRNVAGLGALVAGLRDSVAGVTVNRLCASGQAALFERPAG